MAKQGLWANINRRKKLGISRPKSKSTISPKAYANMKAGFPKRKKLKDGGMNYYGEKSYKEERKRQEKFKDSEKKLDKRYKEIIRKERDIEYLNSIRSEDSTIEYNPTNFKNGGMARGCGKVMPNRRKVTKYF
jgi:hypothetical protein